MPRKKKTEEPIIETTVDVEEIKEIKEPVFKTVSNCKKLNIREAANSSAEVVSVVDAGTVFEIEETDDPVWYKVRNAKIAKNKWCYAMSNFLN